MNMALRMCAALVFLRTEDVSRPWSGPAKMEGADAKPSQVETNIKGSQNPPFDCMATEINR